jgi:hypothetical protein
VGKVNHYPNSTLTWADWIISKIFVFIAIQSHTAQKTNRKKSGRIIANGARGIATKNVTMQKNDGPGYMTRFTILVSLSGMSFSIYMSIDVPTVVAMSAKWDRSPAST